MRDRSSQLFLVTAVKGPKVIGNGGRDCHKIMSAGNPPGTKCDNNEMPLHTKECQGYIPMCEHFFWSKIRG